GTGERPRRPIPRGPHAARGRGGERDGLRNLGSARPAVRHGEGNPERRRHDGVHGARHRREVVHHGDAGCNAGSAGHSTALAFSFRFTRLRVESRQSGVLITTRRVRRVSSATNTRLMPPPPSSFSTRYAVPSAACRRSDNSVIAG